MTKQDEAITEAIKSLRRELKQPMVEFAKTLGISLSSVVRFETHGVIPKRASLKRFADIAKKSGFVSYAAVFESYLIHKAENGAEQLIHLRYLAEIFNGDLQYVARNGGISEADLNEITRHMNAAMHLVREKIKINWFDVMQQGVAEQSELEAEQVEH